MSWPLRILLLWGCLWPLSYLLQRVTIRRIRAANRLAAETGGDKPIELCEPETWRWWLHLVLAPWGFARWGVKWGQMLWRTWESEIDPGLRKRFFAHLAGDIDTHDH